MTRTQRAIKWLRLAAAALADRPAMKRDVARRIDTRRRDILRRGAARIGTW